MLKFRMGGMEPEDRPEDIYDVTGSPCPICQEPISRQGEEPWDYWECPQEHQWIRVVDFRGGLTGTAGVKLVARPAGDTD